MRINVDNLVQREECLFQDQKLNVEVSNGAIKCFIPMKHDDDDHHHLRRKGVCVWLCYLFSLHGKQKRNCFIEALSAISQSWKKKSILQKKNPFKRFSLSAHGTKL